MSVDLPAPFSPTTACTSPRATSNDTSELATTPGKRLVTPRTRTAGAVPAVTPALLAAPAAVSPGASWGP